jgi:exosortase O
MLHVPLGVIGFVAACGAAMGLLRWSGDRSAESASGHPAAAPRPRWLAPALAVLLLGLVLLYSPRPQPAAAASFEWEFPAELVVQAWPLTPNEMNWLSAEGSLPVSATRLRFEWRDLHGSLLFIASDTWRAHHHPERCFTVYGLEVLESQLHLVNADFPLRWLTLNKARDPRPLYSAGYWLQSGQRVTDDYSVRIWDDIAPQPQPWVLVTVLFDNVKDPAETDSSELFVVLRQAVQLSLEGKEVER